MTTIGERIRKLREQKKISQDEMGFELGLTQTNYGRLEKDDKRLNVLHIQKIAEKLKVTVSYLFNEQSKNIIHQHDNQNPNAYNVENLYEYNKELSDKLQEQYELRLKEQFELIEYLKSKNPPL